LVATAFEVGRSLLNFCDGNTSADRDLTNFPDDVNAFASAWSIIQPSLRDPSVALSPSLLHILGSISNDSTAILVRLQELITTLKSRYRRISIGCDENGFITHPKPPQNPMSSITYNISRSAAGGVT
jgi:hypothetical protein